MSFFPQPVISTRIVVAEPLNCIMLPISDWNYWIKKGIKAFARMGHLKYSLYIQCKGWNKTVLSGKCQRLRLRLRDALFLWRGRATQRPTLHSVLRYRWVWMFLPLLFDCNVSNNLNQLINFKHAVNTGLCECVSFRAGIAASRCVSKWCANSIKALPCL